jgi:hypothetical protein
MVKIAAAGVTEFALGAEIGSDLGHNTGVLLRLL